MTNEEFSDQYNSCVSPQERRQSSCTYVSDADLMDVPAPPERDYRQEYVTPVKDQGRCSVCWAFAVVGNLEALYAMKYRQLLSLSAQQLMDCLPSSNHCAFGNSMTSALLDLIQTSGVEPDSDYPYVERDLPCQAQPQLARVRVTGCFNFQLRNEDSYRQALVKYGPIAIAINAKHIQTISGGIIDAITCPPGTPGHAVLMVGYGTENGQDYWILKNSWGSEWGPEQGFFRFARGQNLCGWMNDAAVSGLIA